MADRPMTQREIAKQRQKEEHGTEHISVYNKSKHVIHLQVRPEGMDFYVGEQTIRIPPGKSYADKESSFNQDQIRNLKKRDEIEIK